jgi:hypothetical protein
VIVGEERPRSRKVVLYTRGGAVQSTIGALFSVSRATWGQQSKAQSELCLASLEQPGSIQLCWTNKKILKPKKHEVDKWKMVKGNEHGKKVDFKPTFDYLLPKYVNQKTISKNQSLKGIATSSPNQD